MGIQWYVQYQRFSSNVFMIFLWTRLFKRILGCHSNSIVQGVLAVSIKFGSRFNHYRHVLRKTSFFTIGNDAQCEHFGVLQRSWCQKSVLPATACCVEGLVARRWPHRALWQGHGVTKLTKHSCAFVAARESTTSNSMLGSLCKTLETRAFSWHQAMVKAAKDPRKPMVWPS